MKTLYILLLLVVIIIATLVYQKIMDSTEGFATAQALPTLYSCPHKMQVLNDPKTGDELCCDGKVQGTDCTGSLVCVKTPSASSSLKDCREYLKDYNETQATSFCYPDLPFYYENDKANSSGCASQVNDTTTAPMSGAQSCKIYKDEQQNMFDGNSCQNMKMKYTLQNSNWCKTVGCNAAMGGNGKNIVWINAFYTQRQGSTNPTTTACESSESMLRHVTYGWWEHEPLKGDELARAQQQILAGTYPGMCPDRIVKSIN
jgi:hypothetical protein